MAHNVNEHFTKDTQMTNKYVKDVHHHQLPGKFTPQSQARHHYTLSRIAKIKKTDDAK